MSVKPHPIRTTLIFGLICAMAFIPVNLMLSFALKGQGSHYLTLWLYTAIYALIVSRWAKNSVFSICYPLLLLLVMAFQTDSVTTFYLLSLTITSWIRNGICFRDSSGKQILVEALLCGFGGILVIVYTPESGLAWMSSIWMFFLIQALYFLIFENRAIVPEDLNDSDPFEWASGQAETILSDL
ncbi:MAG: hypothetical protein PVF37_06565 [Desulfobacterales bacterium]|jgi:hypothetical protein